MSRPRKTGAQEEKHAPRCKWMVYVPNSDAQPCGDEARHLALYDSREEHKKGRKQNLCCLHFELYLMESLTGKDVQRFFVPNVPDAPPENSPPVN